MKRYVFECYMCDQVTGAKGWDIVFIAVYCDNRRDAHKILKAIPLFDCIILTDSATELDMANLSNEDYNGICSKYIILN